MLSAKAKRRQPAKNNTDPTTHDSLGPNLSKITPSPMRIEESASVPVGKVEQEKQVALIANIQFNRIICVSH